MSTLYTLVHKYKIQGWTKQKNLKSSDFIFSDGDQFRYELHSLPDDATDSIGTSVLLVQRGMQQLM